MSGVHFSDGFRFGVSFRPSLCPLQHFYFIIHSGPPLKEFITPKSINPVLPPSTFPVPPRLSYGPPSSLFSYAMDGRYSAAREWLSCGPVSPRGRS